MYNGKMKVEIKNVYLILVNFFDSDGNMSIVKLLIAIATRSLEKILSDNFFITVFGCIQVIENIVFRAKPLSNKNFSGDKKASKYIYLPKQNTCVVIT